MKHLVGAALSSTSYLRTHFHCPEDDINYGPRQMGAISTEQSSSELRGGIGTFAHRVDSYVLHHNAYLTLLGLGKTR